MGDLEDEGSSEVSTINRRGKGEVEETRKRPDKTRSKMAVEDVFADPPQRHQLLFEQLYRLATMPRHKKRDFAQTAFWSTLATSVSGIPALLDILAIKPTQDKVLDLSQLTIFCISATALALGALSPPPPETAEDYLNKICGSPAKAPRTLKVWLVKFIEKHVPD